MAKIILILFVFTFFAISCASSPKAKQDVSISESPDLADKIVDSEKQETEKKTAVAEGTKAPPPNSEDDSGILYEGPENIMRCTLEGDTRVLEIKKEPKLEGVLLALPEDAEWIGARAGDMVGYTKNSEYEMELLSGTKVYRMRTTELVYVKEEE